MSALVFFEDRVGGFDHGQAVGGEYTGFDVRVMRYEGVVHIEIRPAAAGGDPDQGPDRRYVAALTPHQAAAMVHGIEEAIHHGS